MVRAGALLTVLLCVAIAPSAAAPSTPAPAPSGWSEAAAEILADDAYQTELPNDSDLPEASPLRASLGPASVVILYGLAGLTLGLLLFWLVHALLEWRRGAPHTEGGTAPGEAGAGPAFGARSLDIARRLAAEGRFAEAIHELLLVAIRYLSVQAVTGRDRSLTSRELVGRLELADERRRAFRELVLAVEISHFGARRPGADEWRSCLERFHALTGQDAT